MPNLARKFKRRKYQQDKRALHAQKKGIRSMNATAPAQPQIEERPITEAEMKMFNKKYAAAQAAQIEVNECMAFLREQHNIDPKDGWQLGQRGFFREVQATPPPPPPSNNGSKAAAPKPRPKGSRAKTVVAPANGAPPPPADEGIQSRAQGAPAEPMLNGHG